MSGAPSLPPPKKALALSVSGRVIVFTLIGWVGLLAGVYFVQQSIFRPTFERIESELLVKDLERVDAAVQRESEQLGRTADDYASWPDMREFLRTTDPVDTPRALNPEILRTLDLDAIFVFDAVGRVKHELSRNSDTTPEYSPKGFASQFPVIASVRTQGPGAHSSQGLVRFKDGRLVFAVAAPVVGEGAGALGTVVMLRELSAAAITRLGEQVRLPLTLRAKEPEGASPAAKDAVPVITSSLISANAWLRDPFGQPIAQFTVERPASILAQGESTLMSGGIGSLVMLSLILAMLILLLQLSVVRPLHFLTRKVESVRRTGDLSVRVSMTRSDEIGLLAYNFDRLLALLGERTQILEQLATTDGLTKLYNRRTIMEYLSTEIQVANEKKSPLSVLLIDVDHFKRINDTSGHAVGDRVLRQVAAVLGGVLGSNGRAGRYGGEEFLIVLPGKARAEASALAERIRCAIIDCEIQGLEWRVTASAGVASFSGHTVHGLLATADMNLYRAKESGRNRVVADDIPFAHLPAASVPPPGSGSTAILL